MILSVLISPLINLEGSEASECFLLLKINLNQTNLLPKQVLYRINVKQISLPSCLTLISHLVSKRRNLLTLFETNRVNLLCEECRILLPGEKKINLLYYWQGGGRARAREWDTERASLHILITFGAIRFSTSSAAASLSQSDLMWAAQRRAATPCLECAMCRRHHECTWSKRARSTSTLSRNNDNNWVKLRRGELKFIWSVQCGGAVRWGWISS